MRVLWMCALVPCVVLAQGRAPSKKAAPPAQTPVPKQTAPAKAAGAAKFPIESITVEGNRIFNRDQILAIAGLKVGQLAARPEFEAARDRLVAAGAFENVSYRFSATSKTEAYAAIFTVAEVEQVYTVVFEDLH